MGKKPILKSVELPNSVTVRVNMADDNLKDMLKLLVDKDFVEQTSLMRDSRSKADFNLLVYDSVLALGIHSEVDKFGVALKGYSHEGLINCLDTALSLYNKPIRVIPKTSTKQEFYKRMSCRLDLDWLTFDSYDNILTEVKSKPCPAYQALDSLPPAKDLYALTSIEGKTYAAHLNLEESEEDSTATSTVRVNLKCICTRNLKYDDSIDNVEKMLHDTHPDALVIREPLRYCTCGSESKPSACLAVMYERMYAKKKYPDHEPVS